MIYITNGLSLSMFDLPNNFDEFTIRVKKISIKQAQKLLLSNEWVSAVGHQATAELLSNVLEIEIPMNRINIKVKPAKDKILVFSLKSRLEEGKIIRTIEELEEIGYDFYLVVGQ